MKKFLLGAAGVAALLCFVASPLAAAIQYPARYTWKSLGGGHFIVHYHQGEEALARQALEFAEQAHVLLSEELGWQPKARVHIAVTDNYDFSNGSATPLPFNNVNIWVTPPPPSAEESIGYYDDWMKLVIFHELAHIYHLDQGRGGIAALRKIFGRLSLAFPNLFSPLWIIEGWATYAESKLTGYGRLNSSYLDMVVRTAALAERLPSMAHASGMSPRWPGGNERYLYGARFLSYVAEKEGDDAWRRYFEDYSSNLIPFRVNSAGKDTFGQTLSDYWEEWQKAEGERAEAVKSSIEKTGTTPITALTALGYETLYPAVSPDGRTVAYVHSGPFRRPSIRIHAAGAGDAGLGNEIDSVVVNVPGPLSFSPDGRWLAYSDPKFVNSFTVRSDLYVYDLDRHDKKRVTRQARLFQPAFSSDGRTLYAVKTNLGGNTLVAVDIATGQERVVVALDRRRPLANPAASPDGAWIAVTEGGGGRADIVLYKPDGTRGKVVTESFPVSLSSHAAWSRDGGTLFFGSDAAGNIPNIFAWDAATGTIRQVTQVVTGAIDPAPLPGGGLLVASYSDKGFDLGSVQIGESQWREPTLGRPVGIAAHVPGPGQSKKIAQAIADAGKATSSRYNPWGSLAPRSWFPILESSTSSGTVLGFSTAGQDALGFHFYALSYAERVGGALDTGGENSDTTEDHQDEIQLDDDRAYVAAYAYTRLFPNLVILAADYNRSYGDLITEVGGDELFYAENVERLQADLSFPWYRWRSAAQLSLGYVHDRLRPLTDISSEVREPGKGDIVTGTLAGPRAGFIFGTWNENGYSISRENGILFAAEYEELLESFGSDYEHWQAKGDLRAYLRMPFGDRPLAMHALAMQLRYGESGGDRIAQRLFRVGGSGYSEELLGIDVNEFPLRGFSNDALSGMKAATATLEYRFPIAIIEKGPDVFPIYFDRLTWTFFGEAGDAWEGRYFRDSKGDIDFDHAIASVGAELGSQMVFGYYAPLTLRLGVAYRVQDNRLPADDSHDYEVYLAGGSAF